MKKWLLIGLFILIIILEFFIGQYAIVPKSIEIKDLIFVLQKIVAIIFIIIFLWSSITDRSNDLLDFGILFIVIYFTFTYNDQRVNTPDTWAHILLLIIFPLTFVIKSIAVFKHKKIEKNSSEYGSYIGIVVFTLLLILRIYFFKFGNI